jgi:hypothetical protein
MKVQGPRTACRRRVFTALSRYATLCNAVTQFSRSSFLRGSAIAKIVGVNAKNLPQYEGKKWDRNGHTVDHERLVENFRELTRNGCKAKKKKREKNCSEVTLSASI